MNSFDTIVYTVILGVMPIIAGAIKNYSSNGIVRILTRFAVPTVSAVLITYTLFFNEMMLSVFNVIDYDNSNVEYMIAISTIAILWYMFYKLVSFGQRIGKQEDAGIQADINMVSYRVMQVFEPKLNNFAENIKNDNDDTLDEFRAKIESTIFPKIENVKENQNKIQDTADSLCNAQEQSVLSLNKLQENVDSLSEKIEDQNQIIGKVNSWLENNPHLYEILLSRIETISIQNKTNKIPDSENMNNDEDSTDDSNTKTLLTTQDGIANRSIGHTKQQEMAQYLHDVGFEVGDGHGAGEPDFIIKKKKITGYDLDGTREESILEIVAVGSCKSYTLKDQPKKKQRRISADDCIPEVTLAKKLRIPMIILVTNRNNSRRWAAKISYDDLVNGDGKGKKWSGISTPVILAQDDPESAQMLEEQFLSILASIGARV